MFLFFLDYRMTIPMNPGTPGDAKYLTKDEDVVGILVNGALLDNHEPTWSYDSCNGHSDTKHQYHYHIPPKCFLESLGVSYPDEPFWWMDGGTVRDYSDMAAQWLATASASPIIGFALDGFPIYGPYDDAGNLMRGKEFGGNLDECNGKVDGQGNYGYYLTVDPPFAPPCLRGEMGVFSYFTTQLACPKDGIDNLIVDISENDGACGSANFMEVVDCVAAANDGSGSAVAGSTSFFQMTIMMAAIVVAIMFG